MSGRNWPWNGYKTAGLLLLAMESAWLIPWFIFLTGWAKFPGRLQLLGSPDRILLVMACFALAAFLLNKVNKNKIRITLLVSILLPTAIAALELIFYTGDWPGWEIFWPLILYILLGIMLWWRVSEVVMAQVEPGEMTARLITGLAALVLLRLLTRGNGAALPDRDFSLYLLVFFTAALSAMLLLFLNQKRQQAGAEGNAPGRLEPAGIATLLAIILAVLLLALVAEPSSLAVAARLAGRAYYLLLDLLYYLVLPLGYLVKILVEWLRSMGIETGINIDPPGQGEDQAPPLPETVPGQLPAGIVYSLQIVTAVLMAALLLYLIYRSLKKASLQKANDAVPEVRESLFSWRDLGKGIRDLFTFMRPNRRRSYINIADPPGSPRYRIRMAYRRFLSIMAEKEKGRAPAQTPREYAFSLRAAGFETEAGFLRLADIYTKARYGREDVDSREAGEAETIVSKL